MELATTARLSEPKLTEPTGVAVDAAGNIYIADRHNHRVRKVDTSGTISTFAGTGVGTRDYGFSGDGGPADRALLAFPEGVVVDAVGNVYIADTDNHRIRMVDASGIIHTIAGSGERGFDGDGGPVWEHWSTTRDIRSSSVIGTSVLEAYLTLVSCVGGRFVAAIARGRREHSHPRQLAALVESGLLTTAEATWDVMPDPIPGAAQNLLYEARPADALAASELLPFTTGTQRYFMFQRRIRRWSKVASVKRDLGI